MKKWKRGTSVMLFAGLLFGAGTFAARAQQMVGGYSDVSAKDKTVVKAAKFAVKEQKTKDGKKYSYVKVVNSQSQVVAGMNYKMCVSLKDNGVEKTAETIVYRNLEGQYSLTSWEWKECRADEKDSKNEED